jgi:hypothetical protein
LTDIELHLRTPELQNSRTPELQNSTPELQKSTIEEIARKNVKYARDKQYCKCK